MCCCLSVRVGLNNSAVINTEKMALLFISVISLLSVKVCGLQGYGISNTVGNKVLHSNKMAAT